LRSHQQIRLLLAALLFVTVILGGCTVPLGPGFHFASRQTSIGQASATSLQVHVRVTDQLTNGGTRALAYLDAALPATGLDTSAVNVLVDGKKAQAAPVTSESGAPLRIRFAPPWPQRQARSFVFDYELSPDSGRPVTAAAPESFHLTDPGALPRWLAPPGFFVTADTQALKEEFDVAVPSTFRVAASGSKQTPKRQGNLTIHRFRLSKQDFPLFVVAGNYQEMPIHTNRGDVIFWTLHPLNAQAAQGAAERLAGTVATYEKTFGPASKGRWPIRIVETQDAPAGSDDIEAVSFPHGALLNQRAMAQGIADDSVLASAEAALARTWFGWADQPALEDRILLGRGAGLFAVVLAAEARGGETARRSAIMRLLAGYDRDQATESIAVIRGAPLSYGYKAALFWVALEDQSGAEHLQRATRFMLQALAGQQITAADFRAALESETGHDLVGVFHTWIDHPGLPADFRARYAATP
jgi:hypothetical protein